MDDEEERLGELLFLFFSPFLSFFIIIIIFFFLIYIYISLSLSLSRSHGESLGGLSSQRVP